MSKAANKRLRVGVLCGGPSAERGISLNSARSICDHLDSPEIEVVPIYFDHLVRPYAVSRSQLYSNTPSDFDFKLAHLAEPLSETQLIERLKGVDIVFPAIHGRFGEDGELQELLEKAGVPFVGATSAACKLAFDKYLANQFLAEKGFYTIPALLIEKYQANDYLKSIEDFFATHALQRAIVKPCRGGSSIAVHSVTTPNEALFAVNNIFNQGNDTRVVIEPFCAGTEFTVIILENFEGKPTALFPIEVEMDYSDNQIFDYRRKYLSSRMVTYHCPARFETPIINQIRQQSEQLFSLFGMRDFARFDGWLLDNGHVYFPDFNPISGMEQNSFLFIQGAQVGFSHRDVLRFVLKRACNRYDIPFDPVPAATKRGASRKRVNVLFGGDTAERHVSVMSGTNVWLKLRQSELYDPRPFLLDIDGGVWEVPYGLALYHTVEEMADLCRSTEARELRFKGLRAQVQQELGAPEGLLSEKQFFPRRMSVEQFVEDSEIVFIALHGGFGENGELQQQLEDARVSYTGSPPQASQIAMDKFTTGEVVTNLHAEGVATARKKSIDYRNISAQADSEWNWLWNNLRSELGSETLIVKPQGDGCSAGVARLFGARDLRFYVEHVREGALRIPPGTLTRQLNVIEMPPHRPERLLFEEFIETLPLTVEGNELHWGPTVVGGNVVRSTPWVEITVGVIGRKGQLHALNPSITVANADILSLEEKFQGGTGINITPPPAEYVSPEVVKRARQSIELVANAIGISGFARIDAFLNYKSGELIIIEANTIPGLTPSTVIFHQGLAEQPSLYPREMLEKILEFRAVF